MQIVLIAVPYDAGQRSVGVGLGPGRLLDAGLANELRQRGHDVREVTVELPSGTAGHELARTVAVQRELGREVHDAIGRDELPIVLAGNCNTAVGTLSARPSNSAVVWFDAHGDFNTAETTTTGMLDGLALSMITGRALRNLTASVDGFVPVEDTQIVLVGARDLDPLEASALSASQVCRVSAGDALPGVLAAVRALGRPVPSLYVHLDLDVLDPREARANQYAAPGGLSASALTATLTELTHAAPLYALAITAYDPAFDRDGRTRQVALEAVRAIIPRQDDSE